MESNGHTDIFSIKMNDKIVGEKIKNSPLNQIAANKDSLEVSFNITKNESV